jgi:hypothetical protein
MRIEDAKEFTVGSKPMLGLAFLGTVGREPVDGPIFA